LQEVIKAYELEHDLYFNPDEELPENGTIEELGDFVPDVENWGALPKENLKEFIYNKLKADPAIGQYFYEWHHQPGAQNPRDFWNHLYWDDASAILSGGQHGYKGDPTPHNPWTTAPGFIIQAMTAWKNIKNILLDAGCGEDLSEIIDSYDWCVSKLKFQTATQYFLKVAETLNNILRMELPGIEIGNPDYDPANEKIAKIADADNTNIEVLVEMILPILTVYFDSLE
jgi:hypothetical protein